MRRFPSQPLTTLGYEGYPMMIFMGGVAALGLGIVALRLYHQDTKLENSKKHHAKGVGYSNVNKEMDHLRNITHKTSPHIDENYYEYSRFNPVNHRR